MFWPCPVSASSLCLCGAQNTPGTPHAFNAQRIIVDEPYIPRKTPVFSCFFLYPWRATKATKATTRGAARHRRETRCPGVHSPSAGQRRGCRAVEGPGPDPPDPPDPLPALDAIDLAIAPMRERKKTVYPTTTTVFRNVELASTPNYSFA